MNTGQQLTVDRLRHYIRVQWQNTGIRPKSVEMTRKTFDDLRLDRKAREVCWYPNTGDMKDPEIDGVRIIIDG